MDNFTKTIFIFFISLLLTQCTKENRFLIEKNKVGELTNASTILELEYIYAKDSLVARLSEGYMGGEDTKYLVANDEYLVYSTNGKHLLTIVPKKEHDSTSGIKYVQIMNSEFKTDKGLSLKSPFKDINTSYLINNIESSLISATLFIDELNATIALDKSDLGINVFDQKEIKVEQIPDLAKIKYMTIWFD
ncbi:MAG: hypothetical protein ACI848_000214 [Roseivirga sp.]|jgi:hypothetical protein